LDKHWSPLLHPACQENEERGADIARIADGKSLTCTVGARIDSRLTRCYCCTTEFCCSTATLATRRQAFHDVAQAPSPEACLMGTSGRQSAAVQSNPAELSQQSRVAEVPELGSRSESHPHSPLQVTCLSSFSTDREAANTTPMPPSRLPSSLSESSARLCEHHRSLNSSVQESPFA
jgi:hypothetical protein